MGHTNLTLATGNIASGVGPFALDEGLVRVAPSQQEVRDEGRLCIACGADKEIARFK